MKLFVIFTILIILIVFLSLIIFQRDKKIEKLEKAIAQSKANEKKQLAERECLESQLEKANCKLSETQIELANCKEILKEKYAELDHEQRLLKIEQSYATAQKNEFFLEKQKLLKEKHKAIEEAKQEVLNLFAFHPKLVELFLEGIDKQQYYDSIMQSVLQHAFENPPQVLKVDIYARIHSATSDKIYITTLNECSCPDHGIRHRPCKHMLYLAYLLGLLQIDQKAQREATEIYNDLGVEIAELRESISQEREKHKKLQSVNIEVQNAINEKPNAYPRIAGLMADLVALQFKNSEIYLRTKAPPAHKAADEVARMRERARVIEKRNIEWDEKLETLRNWFPNIDDVFNADFKVDDWELEEREPTAKEIKDYISKHINAMKFENQRKK